MKDRTPTSAAGVRKKILFFTDCYIFGGCENVLASLLAIPDLQARFQLDFSYRYHNEYEKGVALRIPADSPKHPLYLMSNESFFFRLDSSGKPKLLRFFIRLPFNLSDRLGLYSLFNLIALTLWFRKSAPDLLHIHNGGYPGAASCRIAVLSAKLAGIPKIIFVVNNLATPSGNWLDRRLDSFVRRNVDTFITASLQAKEYLAKNRSVDPERITQIFNTVWDSAISRTRPELLAAYGFPDDCYLIVDVAFLTRRKGQILLLQAMAAIRESDPAAFERMRLLLVGDGEDREYLEGFIAQNGLQAKVCMTGFQADSSDFINGADLFVLPSIANEDMPLVVLDAMRLGKTIISTEVSGIVEEIRNGIDGILLKPESLSGLPDAILNLYRNPALATRLGQSAQIRFREVFSYQTFTQKYLALYTGALAS